MFLKLNIFFSKGETYYRMCFDRFPSFQKPTMAIQLLIFSWVDILMVCLLKMSAGTWCLLALFRCAIGSLHISAALVSYQLAMLRLPCEGNYGIAFMYFKVCSRREYEKNWEQTCSFTELWGRLAAHWESTSGMWLVKHLMNTRYLFKGLMELTQGQTVTNVKE